MPKLWSLKYHFPHVHVYIIKKKQKQWEDELKTNETAYTVGGCELMQPLWRTVWRFLKKLKIELPFGPAIPLLGVYPEKTKNSNSKRYMHPQCSQQYYLQ